MATVQAPGPVEERPAPATAIAGPPSPAAAGPQLGPLPQLQAARSRLTRAELLDRCEAALAEESRALLPLSRRVAEDQAALRQLRYRLARLLLFLKEEGLLALRGCADPRAYYAQRWPGEAVRAAQLDKYLLIAERTPEAAVGRAGVEVLHRIARVEDPALRARLHARLLEGAGPEELRRGVEAAREAAALPEALRGAEVEAALARGRQRRARPGTRRRIEQDEERIHCELTRLVQAAERWGLGDAVRARLRDALDRTVAEAPLPERRRTERTVPRGAPANARLPLDPAAPSSDMAVPPHPAAHSPALVAPQEDLAAPSPAIAPPPARRPPRRTPHQQHLPVGYPAGDLGASRAEQHAACAIVAMELAHRAAEEVMARTRQGGDGIAIELMLCYQRAYAQFRPARVSVEARIRACAEAGLGERAPGAPWPVELDPARVTLPWTWLTLDVIDPFSDPEPTEAERRLHLVLACLRAAGEELGRFLSRLDAGDEVALDVYAQLQAACAAAGRGPGRLRVLFTDGAREAQAQEDARAPERAAEAERLRRAEEARVVLGEDAPPPHFVTVGVAQDGTHVALSLHTGQVLVALGAQGMGKSHLGALLLEGLCLPLPPLNRPGAPGNAVVFAGDWRKGHTRHQHLRGFCGNASVPQWDELRRRYGVQFAMGNAAYGRAILACLPGTARRYEAQYPDLIERGLEVREVRLHPREWSNFGYHLFLGCADQVKGRTQAQVFLSNVIAQLGPDAHIDRVEQELDRARLGGASRPVLKGAFSLIRSLTSEQERAADLVAEPGVPVFCYLESEALGAEQVLSVQLAMMTALSRPLPGDPYLLYVLEEVAKQGVSPELMAAFSEMVREVRHNRRSLYFGAHLPTDLPPDVVTMATGILQFGGTGPQALRRLQELSGLLPGLSLREVQELRPGMAWGGFQRATSSAFVRRPQLLHFRPSCIDAGGETLTRG